MFGSQDTDYKIAFYNYLTETESEIVIYEFRVDVASDYIQNELQLNNVLNFRLNNFINNFKSRLGFILFPYDFVKYCVSRLTYITTTGGGEPILHIPELREPFFNNKILDSVDYNFNSLLSVPTFKYIHDIYLLAVDVILIILFLKFAIKIGRDVLDKY